MCLRPMTSSGPVRQVTGPCGEIVEKSDLSSWEVHHDGSTEQTEDDPPTEGDGGR